MDERHGGRSNALTVDHLIARLEELERASFARRRELVELLIDRVLIDPPELEIRYVLPFGGAAHRKGVLQSRHRGTTCRLAVAGGDGARWRRTGRTSGTTDGSTRT